MNSVLANGAKASVSLGEIKDFSGNILLKMWNAVVPAGHLPFQRHSHLSFEITVVDSGSGVYSTYDAEFPMQAGDVFIFSANEFHCITEVGPEGLGLTNLHFEPRYLWGNSYDALSGDNVNFCFNHSADFKNRIPAHQSKEIMKSVAVIKEELTKKPPEFQLKVKSTLNLLLITLVREFGYTSNTATVSVQKFEELKNAIIYIDEHFTEKLSLTELAELAGMSPNYFSSYFKKISGIALWEYINNKRIDMAIRLIRQTKANKNMLDIALICGFNNTANFNKTFKRVTGMTPSECKKNTYLLVH